MSNYFYKYKHFFFGIVLIICVIVSLYSFFFYTKRYPSTDNAYVNAKIIHVTPEISGYIESLTVTDNQFIHKNKLIFIIHPDKYKYSLDEANSNYLSQIAQITKAKNQVLTQKSQIIKDQIQYNFLLIKVNRYESLLKAGTMSKQNFQSVVADKQNAKAQLDIDKSILQGYIAEQTSVEEKLNALHSEVKINNSMLEHSQYRSPVDGYIAGLNTLNLGEYIVAGKPIFDIVNNDDWWIDANFKEDQLSNIKVGQKVNIKLDMYKHNYLGVVQSISYASGNTFSILPAQNATGNWIKVPQRFTVRIKVNNNLNFPLRVGASCRVTIITKK